MLYTYSFYVPISTYKIKLISCDTSRRMGKQAEYDINKILFFIKRAKQILGK